MTKRTLLVLMVAALGVAFLVAGVYATQQAPETITMESALFAKHTKTLVTFSHKKHSAEYKLACTECHHTYVDGKNTWKEGDEVKKCDACHSEAKAPAGEKLSKAEKIKKYYKDAIHENCQSCHKDMKKKDPATGAPTKCTECHPKAAH